MHFPLKNREENILVLILDSTKSFITRELNPRTKIINETNLVDMDQVIISEYDQIFNQNKDLN